MIALKDLLEECQIIKRIEENTDINLKLETEDEVSDSINKLLTSSSSCRQRALIFCQWKTSVDLIANYLENNVLGEDISFLRLDGTVLPNDRHSVVDRFNNDTSIDLLLLTTHV